MVTITKNIDKCNFRGYKKKPTNVIVQSGLFGISVATACDDHAEFFSKVPQYRW